MNQETLALGKNIISLYYARKRQHLTEGELQVLNRGRSKWECLNEGEQMLGKGTSVNQETLTLSRKKIVALLPEKNMTPDKRRLES